MKVLLSGFFGFGNTGDEAIHLVLRTQIEQKGIDVMSLVKEPKNPNEFARYNFSEVAKAIKLADIVISGGGGLIQDVTSSRSLYYYLSILWYAKKLHKKTAVFAQGIGPVKKRENLFAIKRILKNVDLITVRDKYSFDLIANNSHLNNVHITADLAFLFDEEKEIDLPYKKYVIFAPSKSKNMPQTNMLVKIAHIIEKECSIPVVLFPLFPSFDLDVVKAISDETNFPIINPDVLAERTYLIKHSSFLVGSRYHSILFAGLKGVPFISLSYDPKVINLSEEFGARNLDYGNLSIDEFEKLLKSEFENGFQFTEKLRERSEYLISRAKDNFRLLFDFLFS